ncbi:MAG: homocysteine S-methyltransferase family protein [Clostridia bacterium]|nr:homocysteine S-methyltransferase family protein [Clostridia bacterium]
MNFKDFLAENIVILDGGMGTLLQEQGLPAGHQPELWNISHKESVVDIHKAYFAAGSNVVCTNTFGANLLKFSEDQLKDIITAAVANAKEARSTSEGSQPKFIALDIGPTGRMLKPLGDLDFEEAVSIFAATIRLGAELGVDLILIETMNDSYETKAALLAAKENCSLPVIVSNAYSADGKLMTGASPAAMVAMLEGMGADAVGANCSLGPAQLRGVAEELLYKASVPVVLKPNAGLPQIRNGKTCFDVLADEFADEVASLVENGVRIVGGCCGTTPEYIKALAERCRCHSPKPTEEKDITVVSSYSHAVEFGNSPLLIGERINPTGKKRFKQALLENDINYILSEGVNQQDKGVHILDVNVGLPDINEAKMLCSAVCELQSVTNLPLQIDTADTAAMESALRRYNGKAMINSVNGKATVMDSVFPLVKKYGGVVVALTLDENGIPTTAEGRLAIAKKILNKAAEYGIDKKDIVFDTLAMTISADQNAAKATLDSLRMIKKELGCHTSLGVSNVSFGLPCRDVINSTFFCLALENGLSAAIMNPYSPDMMRAYHSFKALKGLDDNCAEYIAASQCFGTSTSASPQAPSDATQEDFASALQKAIVKGIREQAALATKEMLGLSPALTIVNEHIIPALNIVGKGFEEKKVYLPQLLMSAEAAKSAFEEIKSALAAYGTKATKSTLVLATVQGDIHDIGKNIVRLLLENYGYNVIDLGKDVPPEEIVAAAKSHNAPIVGLSALMTTTVPAMEATIRLLRQELPKCKVIVGGAVLTKDYAEKMGADFYAKDAMEAVRYAEEI